MTAEQIEAAAQLKDTLLCMGFSVLFWFFYHLMTLVFTMRRRAAAYLLHLLFFAVGGLFAFCFILGQTSLGVVRWYLAAGFAAGAAAYRLCFAPAVGWVARGIGRLLRLAARPFAAAWRALAVRPARAIYSHLQNRRALRYNQRMERKRARTREPEEEHQNGGTPAGSKKPIEAYTQT